MRMNRIVILSTLLLSLSSCFTEVDEDIKHQDFNEDHAVLMDEDLIEEDTIVTWLSAEAFELKFDSLTVYLDSLEFYIDTTKKLKDTVVFDLELGSSLAAHYFQVMAQCDSCNVMVLQQFETSLTVQNEGPHCDLLDWKHYFSEPDTLILVDSSGIFQFKNSYLDSLNNSFPEVRKKELMRAIKEHCGEDWVEFSKDAENVYSYPFGVSISKEIVKILILNKNNEVIREKILIFLVPMGC